MPPRQVEESDVVDDVDAAAVGQRTGRGASLSIVLRLFSLALTFGVQAALGRMLSPAEFGLFAMGFTALNFLLLFRDFGLQAAGVQKASLVYSEASLLFWANCLTLALVASCSLVAAPAVAKFYRAPDLTTVLLAMTAAAVVGGLSAQHAMLLRRRFRFVALAAIDIAALTIGIVAAFIVVAFRRDVWALVTLYAVQQAAATVIIICVARWRPSRPRIDAASAGLLKFGAGLTLSSVVIFATNNVASVLVGRWFGEAILGQFSRAQQIYTTPSGVLFTSAYPVVFAGLSRLAGEAPVYRLYYCQTLRRISFMYFIASGLLFIVGPDVIYLLLGPNWTMAGQTLSLLALGLVGVGGAQSIGMLLQSQGRIRDVQVWSVVDGCIRIGAMLAGSAYGLSGLVLGFALSTTFVAAPLAMWYAGRKGPVTLRDQVSVIAPHLPVWPLAAGAAVLGKAAAQFLTATGGYGQSALTLGLAGLLAVAAIAAGALVSAPIRRGALLLMHDVRSLFVYDGGSSRT